MKKIILMLACIASLMSCTSPNIKRAQELKTEYTQKADSVEVVLSAMADVLDITPDEEAYIEAHAYTIAYLRSILVAKNWDLKIVPFVSGVESRMERTISLYVPLSPEKQVYASAYDEMITYRVIAWVFEEWLKLP